jgi:hypothetical protein
VQIVLLANIAVLNHKPFQNKTVLDSLSEQLVTHLAEVETAETEVTQLERESNLIGEEPDKMNVFVDALACLGHIPFLSDPRWKSYHAFSFFKGSKVAQIGPHGHRLQKLEVFQDLAKDLGFRLLNEVKVGFEVCWVGLAASHEKLLRKLYVSLSIETLNSETLDSFLLDLGVQREIRIGFLLLLFLSIGAVLPWFLLFPRWPFFFHNVVFESNDVCSHRFLSLENGKKVDLSLFVTSEIDYILLVPVDLIENPLCFSLLFIICMDFLLL